MRDEVERVVLCIGITSDEFFELAPVRSDGCYDVRFGLRGFVFADPFLPLREGSTFIALVFLSDFFEFHLLSRFLMIFFGNNLISVN